MVFTKQIGFGRVTVLGSTFYGYYDDESMILANAVQYTAGNSGIEPSSGTIQAGESVDITISIPTLNLEPEPQTFNLTIESNDPVNPETIIPISLEIEPSLIAIDPTSFDFGTVLGGDTLENEFILTNNGGSRLIWDASLREPGDQK